MVAHGNLRMGSAMTRTSATRLATPAKFLAALIIVLLAFALLPAGAEAIPTKTVKDCKYQTRTSVIKKKATVVKLGTVKLNVKTGSGYVKFKAPKTGKYAFTFSNATSANMYCDSAFAELQVPKNRYSKYSFLTKMSTKGGKSNTLWLAANKANSSADSGVGKTLPKRTGKIKLAKGKLAFFYYHCSGGKSKVRLTITAIK